MKEKAPKDASNFIYTHRDDRDECVWARQAAAHTPLSVLSDGLTPASRREDQSEGVYFLLFFIWLLYLHSSSFAAMLMFPDQEISGCFCFEPWLAASSSSN